MKYSWLKRTLLILSLSTAFAACDTDDSSDKTSNNVNDNSAVENFSKKGESDGKVVDGKADAWNRTNNPGRFQMAFEHKYEELKQYNEAVSDNIPWPSDYWAYYKDSINVRFHGPNVPSPAEKYDMAFNGWQPNMSFAPLDINDDCDGGVIVDKHDDYYNNLGPAAKWQHENKGIYKARNGNDDDSDGTVDECGGTDYDGIETWWGLCHAWVPASILEPEPNHPVVYNGVEFSVSDLKALIIAMYDDSDALMLGGRCNEKDLERDEFGRLKRTECRDTNAGSFHVVITNLLGKEKRAFAEDRTAGYQVWNQPIYKYKINNQIDLTEKEALAKLSVTAEKIADKLGITVEEAQTRLDNPTGLYNQLFDSPDAASFASVSMITYYLSESHSNEDEALIPNVDRYTRSDNYDYILEIDADGKIVGGEWLNYSQETHPDFLWLPTGRGMWGNNPSIDWNNVKMLLDKAIDPNYDPDAGIVYKEFENTQGLPLDVPDDDDTGVTHTISVTDDIEIKKLKVELNVEHTFMGDLKIGLTKGSTEAILHDRVGGGSDNLIETYTLSEFIGESAMGDWVLSLSDGGNGDTGRLISWKIYVDHGETNIPPETFIEGETAPSIAIPDDDATGITSLITLSGAGTVTSVKVYVDIDHTYVGDLIVSLTHAGVTKDLHTREGGSSANLKKTFRVNSGFSGSSADGDWVLKVSDLGSSDTGVLNSWKVKAFTRE